MYQRQIVAKDSSTCGSPFGDATKQATMKSHYPSQHMKMIFRSTFEPFIVIVHTSHVNWSLSLSLYNECLYSTVSLKTAWTSQSHVAFADLSPLSPVQCFPPTLDSCCLDFGILNRQCCSSIFPLPSFPDNVRWGSP